MQVLCCILLLVLTPDLGYSISNDHKINGSGSSASSSTCASVGGSCIAQGMVRSFTSGTTIRCLGARGCEEGFLCCMKEEYKIRRSLKSEKIKYKNRKIKDKKKKGRAAKNSPDRAMKCPPSQRCGTPDTQNPEGGRCRQRCKPKEFSKDPLNKCKNDFCLCCFRERICKKRKYCSKKNGECRGTCKEGETQLERGCVNECVCCVGPDSVVKPPKPPVACVNETGKCKKKCKEISGERGFTEFGCGKKKSCCLKDCYLWQKEEWYKHGEEWYHECMKGVCKNGIIKTFHEDRHPDCCMGFNGYYVGDGNVYCYHDEDDHGDISYKCQKGNLTQTLEVDPECLPKPKPDKNPENEDNNTEEG